MKLKDLFMQVSYEEVIPAMEAVFASYEKETDSDTQAKRRMVFERIYQNLLEMEPEADVDMMLRVVPGDVSGYYDQEALARNPEYMDGLYSLTAMPWREWLGMEVDKETLENMSVADILGNCLYEMTWWGYDEEDIKKNISKRFNREDDDEKAEDSGESKEPVDVKAQCRQLIESVIPSILPTYAAKIGDPKFEQTLIEVNCKENGAYCMPMANLKALRLPLTSIALYFIYIEGICMMGVGSEIDGQIIISYNWTATSLNELEAILDSEKGKKEMIDLLNKQVDEKIK